MRKLGGYNKKTGSADIQEEKTRLTRFQADKAELEVSELEKKLIPAELVESTWIDYVANVRAKLLSLPNKLAHQVITIDNYAEAEILIKDTVYEALKELADNGLPEKYQSSGEPDQQDLESTA